MRAETDIRTCIVYGLLSSRDGVVRYIGQTLTKPRHRLTGHFHQASEDSSKPVARWIAGERRAGYEITIVPIQEKAPYNTAERFWITAFREWGADLLNCTDGGDGRYGHTLSDEHRRKISEQLTGRALSTEHKAAVSLALSGRKLPDSVKESLSRAHRGKSWSDARKNADLLRGSPARADAARRGRLSIDPEKRRSLAETAALASWEAKRKSGTDRGEHVNSAKLTEGQVIAIRAKLSAGIGPVSLAREYSMSSAAIRKIRDRETWTHI